MKRHSNVTRILLLADTHGALHPAIFDLAKQVDHIVHAGDIGDPRVLDSLIATGADMTAIRGNNDTPANWPARDRDRLSALGDCGELTLPGGHVAVEHGHRANPVRHRHEILRRRHAAARMVVYGHSHRQLIDDSSLPWVVNPGAAGRSRTYGGSGCLLLSADDDNWSVQAYQFALSTWKA